MNLKHIYASGLKISMVWLATCVQPVHAQLVNGSLDNIPGAVAAGWVSFSLEGSPAFLAETGFWRRTTTAGARAQRWWSDGATHDAGISQVVPVTAGNRYRLCAWMNHWWGGGSRASSGSCLFYVGVNPAGSANPLAATWSPGVPDEAGAWVQVCMEVVATGSTLAVFVRADKNSPVSGEQSVFADDVTLEDLGPTGPTATPTITNTPAPDIDNDGLPDAVEHYPPAAGQSNRLLHDSDCDGLLDGQEDANKNGSWDAGVETATRQRDTDGDGLWDGVEVKILSSNPLSNASPGAFTDADNDALPSSHDPNEGARDSDGDRYMDGFEAVAVNLGAVANNTLKPELGDANLDTFVSNIDALLTQALFLGNTTAAAPVFGGRGFRNTDANCDGQISNIDALLLQAFFLGNLPLLPFVL